MKLVNIRININCAGQIVCAHAAFYCVTLHCFQFGVFPLSLIPYKYSVIQKDGLNFVSLYFAFTQTSGVPRGGGVGVFKPPPEILMALQNRAKIKPIVKTVKNC